MGLRQNLLDDSLTEVEVRELITLDADATVRDAIHAMRKHRLGCVAILDDKGTPRGSFTERNMIDLLLNRPEDLDAPLADNLSQDWVCMRRSEPVAKLLEIMGEREMRFICILDDADRAVGLSGQKGLIEYIADHFPRQIKVQVLGGKLYMDQREGA